MFMCLVWVIFVHSLAERFKPGYYYSAALVMPSKTYQRRLEGPVNQAPPPEFNYMELRLECRGAHDSPYE